MATNKERFPHLSFDASPVGRRLAPGAAGAWYRIIVVLAAVAILFALGLDPATEQRSDVDGRDPAASTAYHGQTNWPGSLAQWRSRRDIVRDVGVIGHR